MRHTHWAASWPKQPAGNLGTGLVPHRFPKSAASTQPERQWQLAAPGFRKSLGARAGGQRPSYQSGASVFDDDSDRHGGRELETRADMTPGNSGGRMFGWWSGDPRIIGVVSGQEEDWVFPWSFERGNVVAGGSGFTNLVKWARTNW